MHHRDARQGVLRGEGAADREHGAQGFGLVGGVGEGLHGLGGEGVAGCACGSSRSAAFRQGNGGMEGGRCTGEENDSASLGASYSVHDIQHMEGVMREGDIAIAF